MKQAVPLATRHLGMLALIMIAAGLATSAALLAIRRDLNPIVHGVSFYALGSNGLIQSLAILAVALGSFAVAVGLRRSLYGRRGEDWGTMCIGLWSALIAVAGVVPLDVIPPKSVAGVVHDIAGTAANLFLIAGVFLLQRSVAGDPAWRVLSVVSLPLALAALAAVAAANLARPIFPWGVGQRIYLALLLAWLITAAIELIRSEPRPPPRGEPNYA